MKKTFVLVHGAWHGGWCYQRLAAVLRAGGHEVYVPTLTGLAEKMKKSLASINVSSHIADILELIQFTQIENVILCGHSYGGRVVGAVADRIPERILATIYLDAIIPETGKAGIDYMSDGEVVDLCRTAVAHGGDRVPPMCAASLNVNSADRALVDRLCTPQPLGTYLERVSLSGAYLSIRRKALIRATRWSGGHLLNSVVERVKRDGGWRTYDVDCGHDVMLDAPQQLARILLEV